MQDRPTPSGWDEDYPWHKPWGWRWKLLHNLSPELHWQLTAHPLQSVMCIFLFPDTSNYERPFFISLQEPIFKTFCVELACQKCKDAGKATECKHMLHLVPAWQSSEKHMRLKKVMEDRPDLIASELSGLAFDSLQQCFR